jgi:hypothetical protein
VTAAELLLELFCAVTSHLEVGIYFVPLFHIVGDGFIDLRQGETVPVLAWLDRLSPKLKINAVSASSGCGIWGMNCAVRRRIT